MRTLLVLGLSALVIAVALPWSAAAAQPAPPGVPQPTEADDTAIDTREYQNAELQLSFEYPASWTIGPGEPRGILPDEQFSIRASADPTSAFTVVVYRLGAPVDEDNLDAAFGQLDQQMAAWLGKLPGGNLLDSYDVTIDDVDGREYEYEYEQDGQLVHADTIILPHADQAFEISQWAKDAEYDDRSTDFDDIFASLVLPWTPTEDDEGVG